MPKSKTKPEPKTAQPKRPRGRPKKITAAFTLNDAEHVWKVVHDEAVEVSWEMRYDQIAKKHDALCRELDQYKRELHDLRHQIQIIRAVVAI